MMATLAVAFTQLAESSVVFSPEQAQQVATALDDARYQRDLGPAQPTALVDGVRRTLDEFTRLHKDGRLDARELGFSYRRSEIRAGQVVARVEYRLTPRSPEEIKAEAVRLERSLSWVVQRAWRRAREEIKKTPAG